MFSQSDNNKYQYYGNQLLYYAYEGDFETVKDLINNYNADVDFGDYYGVTALMFAAEQGHDSIVEFLINKQAQLNKNSYENGTSALIGAVKFNHFSIAEKLIRNGADINAIDFDGRSSLHYASMYNYIDVFDMLLYYDAEVEIIDNFGQSPLSYAVSFGNNQIVMLLRLCDANYQIMFGDSSNLFHLAAENSNIWYFETFKKEFQLNENIYGLNPIESAIAGGQYNMLNWFLENSYKLRDTINNVYTPKTLAKYSGSYKTKKIIKKLKIKDYNYFWFDKLGLSWALNFNKKDFFFSNSITLLEARYGFEFELGLLYRISKKSILMPIADNQFYQLLESRKAVYFSNIKNLKLFKIGSDWQFDLFAGYRASKWWGNYDGMEMKIIDNISVSPILGISFNDKTNFKIKFSTEYLDTKIYKSSKLFYSINFNFLLNFRKDESIIKHKYILRY